MPDLYLNYFIIVSEKNFCLICLFAMNATTTALSIGLMTLDLRSHLYIYDRQRHAALLQE